MRPTKVDGNPQFDMELLQSVLQIGNLAYFSGSLMLPKTFFQVLIDTRLLFRETLTGRSVCFDAHINFSDDTGKHLANAAARIKPIYGSRKE